MAVALPEKEYKRRVWAWTMYDWANSAFATTVLAAVLPVYFSQVAGATLPSAAVATSYWSLGLSVSLLLVALLSPILGTISDVMRGKKLFLSIFAGLGIVMTAMLVFVGTGDWVLASVLAVLGRIGFNGANSFYDALLPHVARPDDQDRVSARGYAMGYLGGGLLLAINVVMIQLLPGTWGARLSFVSVAIWWAVFTIPLLRMVPEPAAATARLGGNVVKESFGRLAQTLRDIRQYRELFKYLIAFLIYNDGIGTIIGIAAIYGAELGFETSHLILALLLVQFVGIPYALIFGRLPSKAEKRRPFFLAFVLFNLLALPLVGICGRLLLPVTLSGALGEHYVGTAAAAGEGLYNATDSRLQYSADWQPLTVPGAALDQDADATFFASSTPGSSVNFPFYGKSLRLMHSVGPDYGIWAVTLDGQPVLDADTGGPLLLDGYSKTLRYDRGYSVAAETAGEHLLTLTNTGQRNPDSSGLTTALVSIEVAKPARQSSLPLILATIAVVELLGLALAYVLGPLLFSRLAEKLDTRRSVLLALTVYGVIAIWGFFLDSAIEFWFLAWMVAVVQGGSQALSRSLYASMSPASKSGEFFGLFGIMEKFSAIIGPLLFALAGALLGSSRPAVLSLVVLFIIGGYLLTRVNIEEGKRVAQAEDAAALGEAAHA